MMGGLTFASPVILVALVALPAIWWLLRTTPPRPDREIFPPLRILINLTKREETPATSPWWLTALRMLLAACVILAIAGPVVEPPGSKFDTSGPLALVLDNDWAAAPDWQERLSTARTLIAEAKKNSLPVSLTLTADQTPDPTPVSPDEAERRIAAAVVRPLPANRHAAFAALREALAGRTAGTLAYISSGMAAADDNDLTTLVTSIKAGVIRLVEGDPRTDAAITSVTNVAGTTEVEVSRLNAGAAETLNLEARDTKGRILMRGDVNFTASETTAVGKITAPVELRNDFTHVTLENTAHAGGTYLLDDGFKRRRIALVSGDSRTQSQPLLSPLYYIRVALQPYADIEEPGEADLAKSIPEILASKPSIIILADIGRLPDALYPQMEEWIKNGGTLVRFAGPRLAASSTNDPLVPVQLREGERSLGGALSWSEPQPLAPYPQTGRFAGLPKPDGIVVQRQVLAEPSPTLSDHTWASLADGTPLVTAKKMDAGEIVLFHTSANTSWSNLPLSGHFVEMLRRIAQPSYAGGTSDAPGETMGPYRLLTASGTLTADTAFAKPLRFVNGKLPNPGFDNPPGFYGTEQGLVALNLFRQGDTLKPLRLDVSGANVVRGDLSSATTLELQPILLLVAFLLLVADSIAAFFLGGALSGLRRPAIVSAVVLMAAIPGLMTLPGHVLADDSKPGDAAIISALDNTHLAYVLTGDDALDKVSKAGLAGLSDFLRYRTSLEPGDPRGVDIEHDELSFYPLIYWPVSANAPMPSQDAISRIDAYMRSGGTVLFDTRDQIDDVDGKTVTPNTERLRAILDGLNVPALEPVPHNHVLTKAFYLMQNFPGRYNGSPLWVEASGDPDRESGSTAQRGDGVSPILITGNDFAGAWATDQAGSPLFPTVPPDDRQRELAFRAGVNIVMYMLTGNYKLDQVHVPALLERLGQ